MSHTHTDKYTRNNITTHNLTDTVTEPLANRESDRTLCLVCIENLYNSMSTCLKNIFPWLG